MVILTIILSILLLAVSSLYITKTIKSRRQDIYYIPQGDEEDEEQEPGDFVEFLEPEDSTQFHDDVDEQPQESPQHLKQTPRVISTGDIVITPDPRLSSPLLVQFERFMIDEKAYLNPELNLQTIADALDSNRSYISRLVNDEYQTSLPDYLTRLRVQYAMKYMAVNPFAKQENIALNCGFKNAQNFNKKFKEITQLTPKQWVAQNKKEKSKVSNQECPSET